MSQRVAVLLDERGAPATFNGRVLSVPLPPMRRTAHVSGNQIDVFHCPFCGSGAVVARSDLSIECSFCNSAFTVTVSPVYPAFPMSMGGQPYPWPGRPDGDPAMLGGDPNAMTGGPMGDPGYGGSLIPGGAGAPGGDEDGDGDDDAPPWAKDGDDDDSGNEGDDDDTEAEVGGKKKPPFGKKSSRQTVCYRTANGGLLPPQEYMKHLAIKTARDPNAMAARIKQERSA